MTSAMNALTPALCHGSVAHARLRPQRHQFRYPLFYLRLPLAQLDTLVVRGLGINRRGLLAFHNRDHGPRDGSPLEPWIRQRLAEAGLDRADGAIVLQTFPRCLGYVFNPVSFWFCHDRAGALRAVLAEVNNTFGERHSYWIAHPDQRPIEAHDEFITNKVFHVSPFFPVRGEYRFQFEQQGASGCVRIDYSDGGTPCLVTRIAGRAVPLAGNVALLAALRYPLMTVLVMARIHWQALGLALRRIPFHRKPSPPLEEITR